MPFPVDEQYIAATEGTLGVVFPESYRSAMGVDNGGDVATVDDDWSLFPFLNKVNPQMLSRTCNDLLLENEGARQVHGFPENAVAIAANGSGDYLVFLREDPLRLSSEVHIWRHEDGALEMAAHDFSELEKG
jgi:SMI1-KNR4 cell-wall